MYICNSVFELLCSYELINFKLQLEMFKLHTIHNSSETEGMWTGSRRHYKEKPLGVKWPDEPIKALGVYFTTKNCLKKRVL